MNTTRSEFQKRMSEINVYFETLAMLDRGVCRIVCQTLTGEEEIMPIDSELSKILKANGFVLLYNLIESTVRKSIDAILNVVKDEELTYGDLSDKLKKLWIKQEVKNINANDACIRVLDIAESVLNNELLLLKQECITISGNIDAQKIREIAQAVGCDEPKDGAALKTIKDKRNHLAHGEYTFAEIGKEFSVKDLMTFKQKTEEHLKLVLMNGEDYSNNKKYRAI